MNSIGQLFANLISIFLKGSLHFTLHFLKDIQPSSIEPFEHPFEDESHILYPPKSNLLLRTSLYSLCKNYPQLKRQVTSYLTLTLIIIGWNRDILDTTVQHLGIFPSAPAILYLLHWHIKISPTSDFLHKFTIPSYMWSS